MLQQSGLNSSWFARYEHMSRKYKVGAHAHPEAKEVDEDSAPSGKRGKRRSRGGSSAGFLPSIGVPEEVQRVVQSANNSKGDYNEPCSLRTYQARLSKSIAPAQDPYEPEVRKLAKCTGLSARKVEDLRQIYLEHSRGRKKIDLVSFRKLMCYFGVTSKEVTDRVFEIKEHDNRQLTNHDIAREKSLRFEDFLRIAVLFKQGERTDQAAMLFRIIDVSDDHNLSKFELLRFFCGDLRNKEHKRAMSDVVNELMSLIDEDGSGEVDYDEFIDKVSGDDDVWAMFCAISPFSKMGESIDRRTLSMALTQSLE